MSKNLHWFGNLLIIWYLENKRDLPWRETKDPYPIWLSEIILQQTRVAQGLPYYEKFLNAFPTVFELAQAKEETVLKLWQGLGYYSRARNLHATAKFIAFHNQGEFPKDYKGLLQLKGVGDYTASAIASICFNQATAVVDGNVYRVLSRVFGIETPINSGKGISEFKQLAQKLINPKQPGTFNQALMEFGARHCVPSKPSCEACIFSKMCVAFQWQKVNQLPVKMKKTQVKNHYFNYLVFLSKDGKTLLEQRTQKGIWQNLYQFPLIESKQLWDLKKMKKDKAFVKFSKDYNITSVTQYNEAPIVHKLSHKNLHTTFWILEMDDLSSEAIPIPDVHSYPVPVLIENFILEFPPFKT
ncbi:MAG: A/G-specific adenine glycosylase [Flavobacteriaceae bacterium]